MIARAGGISDWSGTKVGVLMALSCYGFLPAPRQISGFQVNGG